MEMKTFNWRSDDRNRRSIATAFHVGLTVISSVAVSVVEVDGLAVAVAAVGFALPVAVPVVVPVAVVESVGVAVAGGSRPVRASAAGPSETPTQPTTLRRMKEQKRMMAMVKPKRKRKAVVVVDPAVVFVSWRLLLRPRSSGALIVSPTPAVVFAVVPASCAAAVVAAGAGAVAVDPDSGGAAAVEHFDRAAGVVAASARAVDFAVVAAAVVDSFGLVRLTVGGQRFLLPSARVVVKLKTMVGPRLLLVPLLLRASEPQDRRHRPQHPDPRQRQPR